MSSISLYDSQGIQYDLNQYKFNPKTQRYFFILDPKVQFKGFYGNKSKNLFRIQSLGVILQKCWYKMIEYSDEKLPFELPE